MGKSGTAVRTGRWNFALPMRAGHQYRIEFRSSGAMGPTLRFTLKAYEIDLRGTQTREFARAESPKDIEACKKEAVLSLTEPK
jgi:hypothetical protein